MKHELTTQIERKRKALLILPLVIIPFLTMGFWALGGGGTKTMLRKQNEGLNLDLPNAQLKDEKDQNKLSFYEAAERDSAKRIANLREDPFYQMRFGGQNADQQNSNSIQAPELALASEDYRYKDPNEVKVYTKLAELNQQLNVASQPKVDRERKLANSNSKNLVESEDVDRLENMMRTVTGKTDPDAELSQLNEMMEKILDIQHPERFKEKIKPKSLVEKDEVSIVSTLSSSATFSFIDTGKTKNAIINGSGFYGISLSSVTPDQNAIEAVVHESQRLLNGSIIKLRLLSSVNVNGIRVPAGSLVIGAGALNDERFEIQINSIRYNTSVLKVKLEVYDLDGLPGIHIPGAISQEVAKSSIDNAAQMLQVTSLDPSLKTQAANAGLNAAKAMISRKVKQVEVHVKAGYKVLIMDKNNQ